MTSPLNVQHGCFQGSIIHCSQKDEGELAAAYLGPLSRMNPEGLGQRTHAEFTLGKGSMKRELNLQNKSGRGIVILAYGKGEELC